MHIKADSSISTGHVEDSLLTYLWKSNNSFLADNGDFIFSTQSPDSLIALFNGFRLKRKAVIEKYSPILDSEVSDLLHFQNTARLYSFLFFYGRILKKLSPRNTFYDFVKQMETDSKWIKTFPSNTLYRYEVEYLKVHDAIKSIDSFLGFIEKQKIDQDHKDFLKSMYITDLIEKPFKFERHKDLLNSKSLRHVIQREKDNRYVSLIKRSAQLFFSIQHGEPAYNFTAETVTGKKVSLSDFEGKIVFIDNWASWCGPCIVERPKVLKMADKYSGNTNVTFLMISVDAKKSDWMNFLKNQGLSSHYGIDLIIENGMHSEYGKNYNIKFIPKYMLIDQKGFIINSNIHDLPSSVEKLINVNLKNR
ncbi:MAG: TlpA disulfide reductase family protein [Bacteroidota bacterium]